MTACQPLSSSSTDLLIVEAATLLLLQLKRLCEDPPSIRP